MTNDVAFPEETPLETAIGQEVLTIRQRLSKFWVPLQNVTILLVALLAPPALGMPGAMHRLIVAAVIFGLLALRSAGGRKARMIQFFYGYTLACAVFGYSRSFADRTPWAHANLNGAYEVEKFLFFGKLANIRLQELFFNPAHVGPLDYLMTGVYGSFITTSLIVGVLVARWDYPRVKTFLIAQFIVFAIGSMVIYALPTNPPWLSPDSAINNPSGDSDPVYRVTAITVGRGEYSRVGDQNEIAAMPSIHMADTFLLLLLLWPYRRLFRAAAVLYTAMMAFALVYLGEHYVVDAVAGILLASLSWKLAMGWRPYWRFSFGRAGKAHLDPFPAGLSGVAPQVGD